MVIQITFGDLEGYSVIEDETKLCHGTGRLYLCGTEWQTVELNQPIFTQTRIHPALMTYLEEPKLIGSLMGTHDQGLYIANIDVATCYGERCNKR